MILTYKYSTIFLEIGLDLGVGLERVCLVIITGCLSSMVSDKK